MNSVVCNNIHCEYNGGKFCNKKILIIYGGICRDLIGNQGFEKNSTMYK